MTSTDGPSAIEIRPVAEADAPELAAFACARPGEPWTVLIEGMVRSLLEDLARLPRVRGMGLWHGGRLRAVASYEVKRGDPLVFCHCDLLAVQVDARRQGYGVALKRHVIESARAEGAHVVNSRVDARNTAMLDLNRKLGAVIDVIDPEDPEYLLCTIPLGTPSGFW